MSSAMLFKKIIIINVASKKMVKMARNQCLTYPFKFCEAMITGSGFIF